MDTESYEDELLAVARVDPKTIEKKLIAKTSCVYVMAGAPPAIFQPEMLTFGVPKTTAFGTKIPVTYGSSPFRLFTPRVPTQFGFKTFTDKKTGRKNSLMDLSFKNCDYFPEIKAFFHVLRMFDRCVIDAFKKHRADWAPAVSAQKYATEELWKLYSPITNPVTSKTGETYPAKLTLKVMDDSLVFPASTPTGSRVLTLAHEDGIIPDGAWFQGIIQCVHLFFSGQHGLTASFKIVQVKQVEPNEPEQPIGVRECAMEF